MNKTKITYNFPKTENEVKSAYNFIKKELDITPTHPRQIDYYLNVFATYPSLLMVAKSQDLIVGCAFGSKNPFDKDRVEEILIGEVCVLPEFQGNHIGQLLVSNLEINAKKEGFTKLLLGARREVEPFYFKCGFIANFFFQIENDNCLDELKSLTSKYPIKKVEVDNGWTRLTLETVKLVPELEEQVKLRFPNSYINYLFTKEIS